MNERESNILLQDMPLWINDFFELVTFKKTADTEEVLKN